jgi:hypothetical protein
MLVSLLVLHFVLWGAVSDIAVIAWKGLGLLKTDWATVFQELLRAKIAVVVSKKIDEVLLISFGAF